MYRNVELYYEPEKEMGKKEEWLFSEMTSFQHSFLCGLIKENRPKKIVEVGVSAGGTTALILRCLKMLNMESEMYSVDLMERWYRNEEHKTGFVATKILQELKGRINHHFLLGNSFPFFLEQIGDNIDFLILDTTHTLPGEYLDFIACLPFLKEGCVVVLHDTIENHLTYRDAEVATKLLFDIVRADEKYYMLEETINIGGFPNIAAFRVGKETKENIRDLFSAMTVSWGYLLEEREKQKYREIIKKYYGERYLQLFDRIEILQTNTYLQKQILLHYGKDAEYLKMRWEREKTVILYGAGHFAALYYHWAKLNNLHIDGLVISDGQKKKEKCDMEGMPIYFLSELPYRREECAFVIAIDKPYYMLILQNLQKAGYDNVL